MSQPRVLITGGSRGIGRAIALRFAREGAQIVIASRTSSELDSVVEEIEAAGGKGLAAQMNVRDHGSIEAAVYRAVEDFDGEMDVLINNAGIFGLETFENVNLTSWQRFLDVNLTGPFLVTLEALAPLKESERGHIFNIASVAAKQGFERCTAYGASKAGLKGFSDSLREDLRADGVRVTTVYPGQIDTSIWDDIPGDWERSKMGRPEDVAEAVWAAYQGDGDQADVDVTSQGPA